APGAGGGRPAAAVGAAAGEVQLPWGAGGPRPRRVAQVRGDVVGERPGGAEHERLPRLEQGCLGLAHRLRLVAADHRDTLPSPVCPGATVPGSRSAMTIA